MALLLGEDGACPVDADWNTNSNTTQTSVAVLVARRQELGLKPNGGEAQGIPSYDAETPRDDALYPYHVKHSTNMVWAEMARDLLDLLYRPRGAGPTHAPNYWAAAILRVAGAKAVADTQVVGIHEVTTTKGAPKPRSHQSR